MALNAGDPGPTYAFGHYRSFKAAPRALASVAAQLGSVFLSRHTDHHCDVGDASAGNPWERRCEDASKAESEERKSTSAEWLGSKDHP